MRRIILRAITAIVMGILLSLPAVFYAAPHLESGSDDWFAMDVSGIWRVHIDRPPPSPPPSGFTARATISTYSKLEVAGGKTTARDFFHLPSFQRRGLITAWYLPWWLFILPCSVVTAMVFWKTRKRTSLQGFPVELKQPSADPTAQ